MYACWLQVDTGRAAGLPGSAHGQRGAVARERDARAEQIAKAGVGCLQVRQADEDATVIAGDRVTRVDVVALFVRARIRPQRLLRLADIRTAAAMDTERDERKTQ